MLKLLCLAALAAPPGDKEAEEALARFRAAYRSPSAPARATAVADLARTPHKKTLVVLAGLLMGDVNTVRIAAAKGLGDFTDYKRMAVPILMKGLKGPNTKEYDVQVAIYEALGKLKDETAIRTIRRGFDHKEAKVAGAAYRAAGALRDLGSIEIIIEDIEKAEKLIKRNTSGQASPQEARAKKVIKDMIEAMKLITGDGWTTAMEWQIWWKRNQVKVKTGQFKPRK